jgi:type IV secretory pathway VirB9-like protein
MLCRDRVLHPGPDDGAAFMNRLVLALLATAAAVAAVPAQAQIPPRAQAPQAQPGGALVPPPVASPGSPQPFVPGQGVPPGDPFAQGGVPGTALPPAGGGLDGGAPPMDPATVDRAARQSRGDFGDLQRSTGIPLGMTQDAWSRPFQNMAPGQTAPGVVRFQWSPDLVMPIRLRDFMNTAIILPEWERVEDVYIGESYYMQAAIARPNVVLLRSSQSGIDATVTILGASGNLYTFYARSEAFNTRRLTDVQVFVQAPAQAGGAQWFRGANAAAQMTAGQASTGTPPSANNQPDRTGAVFMGGLGQPVPGPTPDGRLNPGGIPVQNAQTPAASPHAVQTPIQQGDAGDMLVPRDRMIFDMQMFEVNEGDRAIAPDYVYSDGVFTYFHFGSRAREIDLPVVFRVVDGVETRVNTRTAGRFGEVLIAEARGDFTLRAGARAVCIRRQPGTVR